MFIVIICCKINYVRYISVVKEDYKNINNEKFPIYGNNFS